MDGGRRWRRSRRKGLGRLVAPSARSSIHFGGSFTIALVRTERSPWWQAGPGFEAEAEADEDEAVVDEERRRRTKTKEKKAVDGLEGGRVTLVYLRDVSNTVHTSSTLDRSSRNDIKSRSSVSFMSSNHESMGTAW